MVAAVSVQQGQKPWREWMKAGKEEFLSDQEKWKWNESVEYLKRKFGLLELLADRTTGRGHTLLWDVGESFYTLFFKLWICTGVFLAAVLSLYWFCSVPVLTPPLSFSLTSWLLPVKHTRIRLIKSWFPFSPWMCLLHRLSKEPSVFLIKQGWSTHDKLKACCSLCILFVQGFTFHLPGFLELLRVWEINAALNQGPESYLKLHYNINLFPIFFFFSVLLPFIVLSALPCQADLLCPIWHAFFFFQLTHNRFFKIWHHYKGPYLSVWYWKWYDSFYILEISLIFSKNSSFVFHFCGSFWFLHLNRLWQMLAFCCASSYKMFVEIKRSVLDF